jgi:hypothetical protein
MNVADTHLIRNLQRVLSDASLERIYYIAQGLHHELVRRGLEAQSEAAALELAILVDVRILRGQLYSATDAPES